MVVRTSRVRMAGILSPSIGHVPGTFVGLVSPPTSTTGIAQLPMPSIVIETSSPARSVKDSGGTMPVPVMR